MFSVFQISSEDSGSYKCIIKNEVGEATANVNLNLSGKSFSTFLFYNSAHPLQASMLTQNDTGPVGPVTPDICWSCQFFIGPSFFL